MRVWHTMQTPASDQLLHYHCQLQHTNGEEEHGDQGGDDVGPAVEAGVTECQVAAVLKVLIASPAQDRS